MVEILRFQQVKKMTGIKHRQTLYRMEKRGEFPERVQIGPNQVGWQKKDIIEFLEKRGVDCEKIKEEDNEQKQQNP